MTESFRGRLSSYGPIIRLFIFIEPRKFGKNRGEVGFLFAPQARRVFHKRLGFRDVFYSCGGF